MSTTTPEAPARRGPVLRTVTTWAVLIASVLISVNLLAADYVGLRAYAALHQVVQQWAPAPAVVPDQTAPVPDQPAPAPAPAPGTGTSPQVSAFGQTHRFDNGVEMTISKPQQYSPSRYASVHEGHAIAVDITIKNGSVMPLSVSGASITASAGQQEGTRIFDGSKMTSPPSTQVLPGKTVRFPAAFGVQSLDDVAVQASPGYDYSAQIWTDSSYRP